MTTDRVLVTSLRARAYVVPTDLPEADGTLAWDRTTLVVVHVEAGGETGIGYTYDHQAAAVLAESKLAHLVCGRDAFDIPAIWETLSEETRNIGRSGVAAAAISAVDTALWDLKAKLLGVPLVKLLGQAQPRIPAYGSGGFTSYDDAQLEKQLSDWADAGMAMVKMKVGSDPARDVARVRLAREAIGPDVQLGVDANGAYRRKQALAFGEAFAAQGVVWFEEPVTSQDRDGLRLLRDRLPAGMDVAAGEYGWDLQHFHDLLAAGAVDCLQIDGTRCLGITGFLQAAALARAHHLEVSAHCAPTLHVPVCCALPHARHIEYFHDHVRIEHLLFDGFRDAAGGRMSPSLDRLGLGIALKESDAARYAV